MVLRHLALLSLLSPLLGSFVAGIFGQYLGRKKAHRVTIACISVSFLAVVALFYCVEWGHASFDGTLYTWALSGAARFDLGFLIDPLSAVMMLLVTFVSLLVHIYSIGYMAEDEGYQRFFSYMSLFTFFMLLLVSANNFLQLFIGWEGVGLVSYLLIGFYFTKESAVKGGLKAFLINRVGDFGFLLGVAAIFDSVGSLNYQSVFSQAQALQQSTVALLPHLPWSLLTVICILLFIGAMGKSAQIPLHVWLPESMEGPTPISALIHAATMVTAGVYMVARLAPLYELSSVALSLVLVVGATGALFLGLLAFVENDIKRVIAYSTMSQLGYMMAANGASAFSASIFHLLNHGCFKALLFLAAGSVIIAMHHEQDLRKMGNLKKYLPVTYVCFLVGALSLAAIPPFAGFYSKDAIVEAVHLAAIPGAHYAYVCLLIGSFVTSYYIFRAFFMAFHTEERMSEKLRAHLKEPSWTMLGVLVILAIPSIILGALLVKPVLSQNFLSVAWEAYRHPIFWISISGILLAWVNVVKLPQLPQLFAHYCSWIRRILVNQYGFDRFNDWVFVKGGKKLSEFFYQVTDVKLIDDCLVNGSGRQINWVAQWLRRLQSGYLYDYVFVMIIGLLGFLVWFII